MRRPVECAILHSASKMNTHFPHISQQADASNQAWTDYWRSGALHSCGTSFSANYGGSIAAFWQGVFSRLQPGDRVLDLATGNGALPQLLIDSRPEPDIACDAIDLAPIAPTWRSRLAAPQQQRLLFLGGTHSECLPFEDRRYALVVSQYGMEYTDLGASVPEMLRVLRRPSRIALLVHHAASRPVSLAQDELLHIDWLLAPKGLLSLATALLHPLAQAGTAVGRQALAHDRHAIESRERFNAAQRLLAQRASNALCPDVLYETREVLAGVLDLAAHGDVAAARGSLASIHSALAHSRVRLTDLRRCALDAAGVAALASRCPCASPPHIAQISEGENLMGWTVQIDLAADEFAD